MNTEIEIEVDKDLEIRRLKILAWFDRYMTDYGNTCRGYPSINRPPDCTLEKTRMQKVKDKAEEIDKELTNVIFKLHWHKACKMEKRAQVALGITPQEYLDRYYYPIKREWGSL